jgi:hypothetical protein
MAVGIMPMIAEKDHPPSVSDYGGQFLPIR